MAIIKIEKKIMKSKLLLTTLLFLLSCLIDVYSADEVITGHVGDYGIFNIRKPGKKMESPKIVAGSQVGSIQSHGRASGEAAILVEKTDKIPVFIGQNFHFWFTIEGLPDGGHDFLLKIDHPEIEKPNGSKSTGYTRVKSLWFSNGIYTSLSGWNFENQNEIVEGEWRFTFSYDEKEIVSKEFVTFLQ